MADPNSDTLEDFIEASVDLPGNPDEEVFQDSEQEADTYTPNDLKSWKKIVSKLQTVSTTDELKAWLRGKLFKSRFMEYYYGFLVRQQMTNKYGKGQDFSSIVKLVAAAQREANPKYTTEEEPETDEWTSTDWTARLFGGLLFKNNTIKQGLFYCSPRREIVLWAILQKVRNAFAPSKVLQPGGGFDLLNLSQRERARAQQINPQLASTAQSNPKPPVKPSAPTDKGKKRKASSMDDDPDSSDGEDDTAWRAEIITRQERLELTRLSETPDMKEDWWKNAFIDQVMRRVRQPPGNDPDSVARETFQMDLFNIADETKDGIEQATSGPSRSKTTEKGTSLQTMVQSTKARSPYQILQSICSEELRWSKVKTAQDIEDKMTADNSNLIIKPTEEAVQSFTKLQQLMDNTIYQRQNHFQACLNLGITNPKRPKLPGMSLNSKLHFWQPVAVNAIREFAENGQIRGGILADELGLGKTWVTIGYILALVRSMNANEISKPTLVVVLPHLVWQWAAEFRRITDELDIFVYFGDARAGASPVSCEIIDILENNHRVFSRHRRYRKAVVITSYHTLAHRNGPQKQAEWLVKQKHDTTVDLKHPPILARGDWPRNLGGLFRTVILDEAHQIRNLSSHQSVTLRWLRAEFNLLLTGTPLFNSVDDFKGLAPFLLKEENNSLWSKHEKSLPSFNPFEDFGDSDDAQAASELRLTTWAADKWIINNAGCSPATLGQYLSKIWEAVLIRRTHSSTITFKDGRIIASAIPPLLTKQISISFYQAELEQYLQWSQQISRHLVIRLSNGQLGFNMAYYRELVLITTWLWFRYAGKATLNTSGNTLDQLLHRGILAKKWVVYAMKSENEVYSKRKEWYQSAGKSDPLPEHQAWDIPKSPKNISDEDTLVHLLQGSPKLRALLPRIQEEVLRLHEKSLVWCVNPTQQFFVAAALRLAGIDAHVYHSDLDANARERLRYRFNTDQDRCMTLICSYYVSSAGSNMQGLCRNSHQFDIPMSDAYRSQSIGRVHRLGQTRVVKAYDYVVRPSFNVRQIERNIKKAIPGTAAQINPELFDEKSDSAKENVELGHWAKNKDGTISQVSADTYANLSAVYQLEPTELVASVLGVVRGAKEIREKSDWTPAVGGD